MTNVTEQLVPDVSAKIALTQAKPGVDAFTEVEKVRPKRTPGERLVDWFVYPVINNIGVFGVSVIATYLTSEGSKVGKPGSTLNNVGTWFERRGKRMVDFFKGHGMTDDQAAMSKTVFFSFADGTVIAPFVKLLEDRREHMAKWFDTQLGTKPKDESVYKVEPKQTWGSVITGRLATSLIVVPTAVAMDGVRRNIGESAMSTKGWRWKGAEGNSLNDLAFNYPGTKMGEKIAANSKLANRFGKLKLPELFKIIYFEAFYTSVCTGGLYVISRFFAKHNNDHKKALQEYRVEHTQQHHAGHLPAPESGAIVKDTTDTPQNAVTDTTHLARVAVPSSQEITA